MPTAVAQRAMPPTGMSPAAAVLKQQGNEALRQGRYKDAADFYTQALGIESKSAVLLSNRAEAKLRQGKWAGAFEDANAAALADPGYAKAQFRRGAALSGMGRHSDAVDAYWGAMSLEGADVKVLQEKVDEESALAWPVRVREFPKLGRAAVAAADIAAGTDALDETPAISWPDQAPDERIAKIFTAHGLNPSSSAAMVFAAVPTLKQQAFDVLKDLSAPEVDVGGGAGDLLPYLNAARDIAKQAPELFSNDPYYVARLMLATKTNTHHVVAMDADGKTRGGLFRLGSKLSHSCAPSAVYVHKAGKVRFTAGRDISAGELVSFSYRGELEFLELPAHKRQEELRKYFFFTCMCDRCLRSDPLRSIACDCKPGAFITPEGTSDAWECAECCRRFTPEQMSTKLEEEARLEKAVEEATGASVKEDGMLQRLGQVLETVRSTLGERHWLCGRLLRRASAVLAAAVKAGGGVEMGQRMLGVGAHHLRWLGDTGLAREAPCLAAHTAAILAVRLESLLPNDAPAYPSGESVTLSAAASSLLTEALPLMEAVYSAEDATTKRALDLAKKLGLEVGKLRGARNPSDWLPAPPPLTSLL
eukprot:Hpha_TRINITY_DN15203_c0_g2::TRINITY_DN15203_c0_g2_i2::g.65310::m.65310